MAGALMLLAPELQVYYVTSRLYELDQALRVKQGDLPDTYLEDHQNVLVDSGKRVKIVDNGLLHPDLVYDMVTFNGTLPFSPEEISNHGTRCKGPAEDCYICEPVSVLVPLPAAPSVPEPDDEECDNCARNVDECRCGDMTTIGADSIRWEFDVDRINAKLAGLGLASLVPTSEPVAVPDGEEHERTERAEVAAWWAMNAQLDTLDAAMGPSQREQWATEQWRMRQRRDMGRMPEYRAILFTFRGGPLASMMVGTVEDLARWLRDAYHDSEPDRLPVELFVPGPGGERMHPIPYRVEGANEWNGNGYAYPSVTVTFPDGHTESTRFRLDGNS